VGERELERRSDHSWGHHGPHMSLVRDVDVTWIKAMKKKVDCNGGWYIRGM
jgi:tRNA G26 N,N-dimethylase Trm1